MQLLVVDATNRVKRLYKAMLTDIGDRFIGEVRRVAAAYGGPPVVLCWDHPDSKQPRRAIYPDYKKERLLDEPTEACVRQTLVDCKPQFTCWYSSQHEADDLIAAIAIQFPKIPMIIYGNDKDYHPLLLTGTRLHLTATVGPVAQWEVYNQQLVEEKYKIKLHQFREYQALVGDSVDDIPGIDKIGKDSAVKIFQVADTVAEAVRRIDELPIEKFRRAALLKGYQDGTFDIMMRLVSPLPVDHIPERVQATIRAGEQLSLSVTANLTPADLLKPRPPF